MRFKYLKLRDWGPFKGTHTFAFDGTLIGIVGPNGAGKSTIIEALYTALTGDFRKYSTLLDFVRDLPGGEKSKSGSIEIGFDHADVEVVVRRTVSISSTKSGMSGAQKPVLRMRRVAESDWTEVSGANAVNAAIRNLLGDDISIMGHYAFIEQREIAAIVDSDDSTRTQALHKLFGMVRFEKLWTLLGNEISTIPEIKTVDDLEALGRERNEINQRCQAIQSKKSQVQATIDSLNAIQAQADIDLWDRLSELQTKVVTADTTYTSAVGFCNTQSQHERLAEANVARLDEEHSKVASQAAAAQDFLDAAHVATQAICDRDRLNKEAAELVEKLKTHISSKPNEPVLSFTEENEEQLSQMNAKFVSSRTFLTEHQPLLQGGSVVAKCPTCGQSIPDLAAAISEHQKVVADLQPKINELHVVKMADASAKSAFDLAIARHGGTLASLQQQVIEIRTEFEDLKDRIPNNVEQYSDVELAKRRSVIAEEQSLSGALTTAKANLDQCRKQSHDAKVAMDKASESRNALRAELDSMGVGGKTFSAEHIEKCRDTIKLVSSNREEQVRLEEQAKAAERELVNITQRLQIAQRIADQAEKANFARTILEDARDLFHRDNVPMILARRYLQAVDSTLESFLRLMQSNFTAGLVQEDGCYRFQCIFPDSSVRSASNLSGGQKVRFAISFLMAVNEVLASKLGVMAFDEPTDQLDDANIQHLCDVLLHVQQFAHSAGIQIFVVTHDKQLISSFDQTIQIVDGRQAA